VTFVEVQVQRLGIDAATRTPVVVLREVEGERSLPIWIGPAEANAIAIRLTGMTTPRPLTHDLLVTMLERLGGAVVLVDIQGLEQGTYMAEITVETQPDRVGFDARPSDAIVLALSHDAPVRVREDLLGRAEITLMDSPLDQAAPGTQGTSVVEPISGQELADYLKTLRPEDFGRFQP
jgi:bifunctional DNase/RNase